MSGARSQPRALQSFPREICDGSRRLDTRMVYFDPRRPLREHAEQVERCDVAFAIHGAQLTNTLFMRGGATVIELLPERR